jgi:hypothetical protein
MILHELGSAMDTEDPDKRGASLGLTGPGILEEYQLKVEEQRKEISDR